MFKTKERAGEMFILSETLFWSLFPVISVLLLTAYDPIFIIGVSTMISAVFFFVVLLKQKKLSELWNKKALYPMIGTTLILGIFYYIVYFIGLQYTSATNASIMSLTQQFFTVLYFSILSKHEKTTTQHVIGGLLIASGALIIIIKPSFGVSKGDLIILFGNMIAPFGSYYMQKARQHVSAVTIMLFRSLFGGLFLISLSYFLEGNFPTSFSPMYMFLILFSGIVLMGYSKILWIEGIYRINISKAFAISSTAPAFTIIYALIFLNETPTLKQILAIIPVLIGYQIITYHKMKHVPTKT